MARTEVPTYTTNQLITSSHANTYWRDNINALWPFTTAGDMSYASAADTLARLGIGANGTILKSTGSAPAWLALGDAGRRLKSDGSDASWGYGAPLIAYGIGTISSTWTSTSTASYQNTTLTVTINLPVDGYIIAIAHMAVYSNSSGWNIIYRTQIDGTGGETHIGSFDRWVPGSCAYMKACSSGNRVCRVQAYGYSTAAGSINNGEIIAFAFPQA